MASVSVSSDAAILERVIEPNRGNWSRAAAESILNFRFPSPDVERMNELAAKARTGATTSEEKTELESYMRVGRLLELFQSKARLSLKTATG
jgi:hypothetical protein